ncbi:MAG: hypothetical protein A2Y02_03400 [Omnitrophica bacterium GWA2_52_12]|nr:MAG: hypothetical protein A2Y02_03400 [Omnitrophica bacterium GWA2_52_12]
MIGFSDLNPFAFACLFNAFLAISLGIFVFFAPTSNNKLARLWTVASIFIGLWSYGLGMMTSEANIQKALVWMKIHYLGCIFIPPSYFHFVSVLTRDKKWHRKTVLVAYGISLILLMLNLNGLLVRTVQPIGEFKNYTVVGQYYFLFVLHILFFVFYLHYLLFKEYPKALGQRKTQIKLMFIASFTGFLGGLSTLFPVYHIVSFYHLNYFMGLYAIIMTYAVLKHKLMDIDLIIKRTLVFAGLLAFVFGVFSAATMLVREVISHYFQASHTLTYTISLFLIVLGYDPIRNILINLTDNYLFQKKYDYQKFLKEASRGMSRIKSLEHLLNLVVHFITMKMRVENAAVLTRRVSGAGFNLQYQRGYKELPDLVLLTEGHPLIEYFRCEKEGLDLEQVKEMVGSGKRVAVRGEENEFYNFKEISVAMEELHTACCIPSFLGQELRNVLLLGPKKSGEYFTEEDRNVLYTLAQESAIAIENARLYDEAINKTRELERINHQLEDAKGSLTTALSETERANKQLQDTQAQLIHEQKMATLGRLAASVGHEVNNPLTILSMNVSRALMRYKKNPEVKVAEILDIFQKMEQNISRIKAVVNTLTGLLKKSEKGKFEPLSLKLILEETLPLVQFQTYLENLAGTEVEFNVPGNIPLIRGDLERLQEVFLNLFINAYHAMEGRPSPRINVRAELSPDGHYVVVHFTDSGKGMNEETMKRIFNYGYTTKPAGKGSGLGLYMCKYIIELHGGTIQVSSEEGVGTTFSLSLPAFDEIENLSGHEYRTVG